MNLLDLFFPKKCLECGDFGNYICERCIFKVPKARQTCCECGYYSFAGKTHPSCFRETSLDGHFSVWQYGGVMRKAIHAFKYRFASDVARELSLYWQIDSLEFSDAVLVAVPLHVARQKWRGFNQSELIAKCLMRQKGYCYAENALIRTKNTTPQAQLGKKERLQNMRGKFAVNPSFKEQIGNYKTVILVDDVWTTGATMKEAAKALKKAGSNSVWGFTLAS